MQRCLTCQSVMTATETVCLACGTEIKVEDKGAKVGRVVNKVTLFLFWASAASGVVGLFMTDGPPVKASFLIAVLLLLLKSSAKEMVKSGL